MVNCPYGSGLRPNRDGNAGIIIRRADLREIALPDREARGIVPVYADDGETVIGYNADLAVILAPEFLSLYGVLYGPEIASSFCQGPPPVDFPGADPGSANLAAIAALNTWNQFCRCLPPPGCDLYGGLGQCAGIPYTVTVSWIRQGSGEVFTLTRGCPNEFFDPNQLYGPIGALTIREEFNRFSLEIQAFGQFGQPITVNMSDENSFPIDSFQVLDIRRCDNLDDNCCGPDDEPPPPPIDYPDPTFPINCPECGPDGDMTVIFVPCCPGPPGEDGEDGEDLTMFDVYAEPIGGLIDFEGMLFDDTGGPCYGFQAVALDIPPGSSREPPQFSITGRYDLARVRLGASGTYTSWIIVDSPNFRFVDKINGPYTAIEIKPRPGVTLAMYVMRKQEEQE